MKNQKEKQDKKKTSNLKKISNTISDIVSNPKVKSSINIGKCGYNIYNSCDAIYHNKCEEFCENKGKSFIADEAANAIVTGLGTLIPALGTGLFPVVGALACSMLICYALSKI